MALKLRKFQKQGVLAIEKKFGGRALLADDMGLGKTIQTIVWMVKKDALPALVICPANLKLHWQREILSNYPDMEVEVLNGTRPSSTRVFSRHKVVICNYEITAAWFPYLKKIGFELIVLDEVHYIKSPAAKRTKICRELCKKAPFLIFLSGTPMLNRPVELWNPVNLLRPDEFDNFMEFGFRYCKPVRSRWGWLYRGAERLDELHSRLTDLCMIRRTKKQVMHELPDKSRHVVPIEVSNWNEYVRAEREFISWLRSKSVHRAIRAKKAQELTKIGYLRQLVAELKMRDACSWIDMLSADTEEKVVVFAWHKNIISQLKERYPNALFITADVRGANRDAVVASFQKPENNMLVAQSKTAGVGLNGLQVASISVTLEVPWSPSDMDQCEDRLHRMHQKSATYHYYLVAANTIDERIIKLLQKKRSNIEAAIDGKTSVDDKDVYDQLIADLKRKR